MDSWVFSFAVAPDQAKCYVNWCLVYPGGILHWHMHLLDVYRFHNVDDISRMHHDRNNILDWGVGPWKRKIEAQAGLKMQSREVLDGVPPAKKRKINKARVPRGNSPEGNSREGRIVIVDRAIQWVLEMNVDNMMDFMEIKMMLCTRTLPEGAKS